MTKAKGKTRPSPFQLSNPIMFMEMDDSTHEIEVHLVCPRSCQSPGGRLVGAATVEASAYAMLGLESKLPNGTIGLVTRIRTVRSNFVH